ncbi:MAG: hypothetical protein BWK76_20955 [Desulfobulbaceae bacterium A2]|nr:MAG: hypothetical protein BWK76_20955 [Desulfobulbaceae bacterium A2]
MIVLDTLFARLPLPLLAALIQFVALCVALLLWWLLAFPWIWLVVFQAVLACMLARGAGMAWWWQLIQLAFFPLLLAAQSLALAPSWYFFIFFILITIFYNAARERVPLYCTGPRTVQALLRHLPEREGLRLLDAGAGWGSVLAGLSRARPDALFDGVENAPLSFFLGQMRLACRRNVRLAYGDLWRRNFAEYDVVYAFLSPAVMERLWRKAQGEMRPGSVLISNTFVVPGVPADKVVEVGDRRGARLYCWYFPVKDA